MQKVTRVLGATGVEALAEESSGGEPGRQGRCRAVAVGMAPICRVPPRAPDSPSDNGTAARPSERNRPPRDRQQNRRRTEEGSSGPKRIRGPQSLEDASGVMSKADRLSDFP